MRYLALIAAIAISVAAWAEDEEYYDLHVTGQPWLRTVTPEYQPRGRDREETYKVYTHVYNFDGDGFLTKGSGGLYTHHRGLFIGWMQTTYEGETVDTWHMRGCYQAHVEWLEQDIGESASLQVELIEWRDRNDEPFLRETRTISAQVGEGGTRILNFQSRLEAFEAPVQLRGDLQHAGMQIRLANEVSEHPESTEYVLPETAEVLEDDEVIGAWWSGCNADIGGKRYGFVHMTRVDHPTGAPVYSIRPYGRFGAFSEHEIAPGVPLELNYRIVVSDEPLDRARCDALFKAYAAEYLKDTGEQAVANR